jgi:hypothetical protein
MLSVAYKATETASSKTKTTRKFWFPAVAASIVVILSVGLYFSIQNTNTKTVNVLGDCGNDPMVCFDGIGHEDINKYVEEYFIDDEEIHTPNTNNGLINDNLNQSASDSNLTD